MLPEGGAVGCVRVGACEWDATGDPNADGREVGVETFDGPTSFAKRESTAVMDEPAIGSGSGIGSSSSGSRKAVGGELECDDRETVDA